MTHDEAQRAVLDAAIAWHTAENVAHGFELHEAVAELLELSAEPANG